MFIFLPATLDNICGGDIIGEGLSVSQIKISRICKSLVLFIIVFGSMNGGFMLNICNININIPNIWTCFIEHSFSVPFLFSQPSWLVLYGPTKSQQKDTYVLKWIRSWSWINLQVKWLDAPPAFVSWMILTLSLTAVLCVDIPNWLI